VLSDGGFRSRRSSLFRGPDQSALDTMLISAVWGLGKPVVDGSMTPDTYVISRRPGKGILEIRTASKAKRLVPPR